MEFLLPIWITLEKWEKREDLRVSTEKEKKKKVN